jgi:YidC/Oxa1 family membrane protein insertase
VERRYLAFIIASFAILMLWSMMQPRPAPVVPPPAKQQEQREEVEQRAATRRPALDAHLADVVPPEDEKVAEDAAKQPPFVSLGSLATNTPYRMAVVFSSRGATIHRLTLSSPRYRDLDNKGGSWGTLELEEGAGGVVVQSVPPGCPADAAGLRAGDVIQSIVAPETRGSKGERRIASVKDLAKVLAATKPGTKVEVEFLRNGAQQKATVSLIRRPLDLIRPEAENVLLHERKLPANFTQDPSLELTIDRVGPTRPDKEVLEKANRELAEGVWLATRIDDSTVEFRKTLRTLKLEVIKRFRLAEVPQDKRDDREFPGYHIDFDVEFKNLATEPQSVSYRLQGPNGLPVEGWWYAQKVGRRWGAYGIRDVVLRHYGAGAIDFSVHRITADKVEPLSDGNSLSFVAVDAQYFASAIVPKKEKTDELWYAIVEPSLASTEVEPDNKYKVRYGNASFRLVSSDLAMAPGETAGHATTLFAGPKDPGLLSHYAMADTTTLEPVVYYGYAGSLGIPQLMVFLLSFFYNIVGNYGLAIVMLTVLVRGSIMPFSRRQAKSMLKMQALKPEMDRIAAKYKDDLQARAQAQRELMAKNNCHPMGSCWLMLIQLPIFIGLYRALMVDVDLRQASLIPGLQWCSNLAAPDRLIDWSGMWWQWFNNGEGIFALGPYFNLLPILTVALFLVQQKLFMPPPTDDQTRMQLKVMQFMMIFMAFMFFRVASGLCLYFIASSIWGIVERSLLSPPGKGGTPALVVPADEPGGPRNRRTKSPKPEGQNRPKAKRPNKKK